MSLAKPNIAESRFGVDGSNADAANFTAPSSGQRDTGWVLNQIPPSSVATYLQNKTYRWLQFLDEVFKVAGTAVADFKLTGAMAVTGTLAAGGALTVSSGGAAITGTLAVTGGATVSTTLGVTGAATVGGTLGVTGAITATGGINAFTANGLITASAGVTASANQHVTVSGSGELKHGDRTLSLSPHLALVMSGTPSFQFSNTSFGSAGGILAYGVPLKAGDRLKSYTVGLVGDGSVDISCTLIRISATGVQTLDATTITNAPASYVITPITPAAQTPLAAGEFYSVALGASGGTSNVFFGAVCPTYDRP